MPYLINKNEPVWVPRIPDDDHFSYCENPAIVLSDEYGRHSLVESSAIHVDGGADGGDEANNVAVDLVSIHKTLHCDGKSGGAGRGRIGWWET